jgi:MFS family permease
LITVILLGISIRICSINYGLPSVVGPDETRQILDAFNMGGRGSLLPMEHTYAALHKYLLLFIYAFGFCLAKIFGVVSDKFDFACGFMINSYPFYLAARVLSAILGSAVILLVYRASVTLFRDNEAGLVAAALAAFNFHLVQLSYWATSDILLVCLSAAVFLFIFKYIRSANFSDGISAALFTGLAISAKFQGFFLLVPLITAYLLTPLPRHKKIWLRVAALFALGALAGNAAYLFKPVDAFARLLALRGEAEFGISSAPIFKHSLLGASLWYLKELVRQDGIIGAIFIAGVVYSVIRRRKEDIVFLSCVVCFFAAFSRSSLRFLYYGAFLFPAFCIFGAGALPGIYKLNKRLGRILAFAAAPIILVFSMPGLISVSYQRMQPDTRQLAKHWIEENIASGEHIALDWYELNVPLVSDIPFMFRTGNALGYYDKFIPERIKAAYRQLTGRQKSYLITDIIYERQAGFWPPEMPSAVIDKAERIPIIKRLYQRFNFLSRAELNRAAVKYLVLSSYSYGHFLLDGDPQKGPLFNPYIREDVLANNRQAASFNLGLEQGMLFFLCQRARNFYQPILRGDAADIKLIKEFYPGKGHLGPVVKIYKLIPGKV